MGAYFSLGLIQHTKTGSFLMTFNKESNENHKTDPLFEITTVVPDFFTIIFGSIEWNWRLNLIKCYAMLIKEHRVFSQSIFTDHIQSTYVWHWNNCFFQNNTSLKTVQSNVFFTSKIIIKEKLLEERLHYLYTFKIN